ncbi:MAG: GTP 3',8-cyclase MoaA [Eggerthellaceae bacterium]|nr:GTP 3',8-cyclase MoaA [Eggerthellaceae bacterium]
MLQDEFGRHINYLRISITDLCNLRCIYCMPSEGIQLRPHNENLTFEEIVEFVSIAAAYGIEHIRLTGGEPLVRKGIVDLVAKLSAIKGIKSIAMTTNGILLPKYAQALKEAGLSRVNISIDTLDEQEYSRITRGGNLTDARDGIKAALEYNFHPVKINVVAAKSFKQNYLDFAKMTLHSPLHVRFIEFMPIGHIATEPTQDDLSLSWEANPTIATKDLINYISNQAKEAGLGTLSPLTSDKAPLTLGPANSYILPQAQGTIGFISAISDHFCSTCNRIRLTADGKIRPCLFSDTELDVRTPLRENDINKVHEIIAKALHIKPEAHFHKTGTERSMVQIGG